MSRVWVRLPGSWWGGEEGEEDGGERLCCWSSVSLSLISRCTSSLTLSTSTSCDVAAYCAMQ